MEPYVKICRDKIYPEIMYFSKDIYYLFKKTTTVYFYSNNKYLYFSNIKKDDREFEQAFIYKTNNGEACIFKKIILENINELISEDTREIIIDKLKIYKNGFKIKKEYITNCFNNKTDTNSSKGEKEHETSFNSSV